MKTRILLIIIVLFSTANLFAQKKPSKIVIESTERGEFNTKLGVSKFAGNCRFRHENAILLCDSANLNDKTNVLDAFGNVRIVQADTITVTSKSLHYDGNTKKAELFDDVTLSDSKAVLTTDYLEYDMATRVGTYPNPGKITNAGNVLTSNSGYYFAGSKEAFFERNVVIVTPQAEIKSDTLKYNTASGIADFFGPTRIQGKDDFIYTENGWYNTKTEQATGSKNSYYETGTKTLKGDSLFYDRKIGYGRGIKNVYFIDTAERIILQGDYGQYNKRSEEAFVTKRALLSLVQEKDTLFLTADTLKTLRIQSKIKTTPNAPLITDSLTTATVDERKIDSVKTAKKSILPPVGPGITKPLDTVTKAKKVEEKVAVKVTKIDSSKLVKVDSVKTPPLDTTRHRIVYAYHNVRIYKSDFQAVSDSLVYTYVDSIMRCYKRPAMWAQESQMTADQIDLEIKNKKLYRMRLNSSSFIVNQDLDTTKFNQIAGKKMIGFFVDNKLTRMLVNGNAESIYYPLEDSVKKEYTGMNRSICSNMVLTFKENKLKTVRWDKDVEGKLHPISKIPTGEDKLDGFNWRKGERPISKEDIFRKVIVPEKKKVEDEKQGKPLNKNIKPAPRKPTERKENGPKPSSLRKGGISPISRQ